MLQFYWIVEFRKNSWTESSVSGLIRHKLVNCVFKSWNKENRFSPCCEIVCVVDALCSCWL